MLQCIRTLPDKIVVAVSGGVDSLAIAHLAIQQNRKVVLLHVNHGDCVADDELLCVKKFASEHNLMLFQTLVDDAGNTEKTWRDARYKHFHSWDLPVVTGHNLDDAVEWYLMTCLRGRGEYMEYSNKNVIRPLILTKKDVIIKYAVDNEIEWFEDPTNLNVEWTSRNRIRHNILPECLKINPGLYSIVKKRIFNKTLGKID